MGGVADTDGGAILHPRRAPFTVVRFPPSAHVARFVDHYWLVRWQVESGAEHRQLVLSHPVVNVSVNESTLRVVGPSTRVIERRLTGEGWTFGVMFRPAGFWPLLGRSMATIADHEFALADVLPNSATAMRTVAEVAARDEHGAAADEVFGKLLPSSPQPSELVTAWAEVARSDPGVLRAGQLAEAVGVSTRTLQRRFTTYLGLHPKAVIQRYRVQDVAERARRGDVDWAATAAELGYADQAHLIRDFRAVTGETPGRYVRAEAGDVGGPR